MITTLIFDLDGTLLNTIKDLALSCNYTLKKHGLPEHSEDEYRYFVGNGMTKLVERALPEAQRIPEYIEQFRDEFVRYYDEHKKDHTKPYDGIPELVAKLQEKGYKMAVASNKINAATQDLVQNFFPGINFKAVYGQRANIPPKPNPKIIDDILKDLNSQTDETLLIGDSATDMQTAVNAGIKGIGVQWGFRTKEELILNGAFYTVKNPMQILAVLDLLT